MKCYDPNAMSLFRSFSCSVNKLYMNRIRCVGNVTVMSRMYNENYVQCEFVKVCSHVAFTFVSTSTSLTCVNSDANSFSVLASALTQCQV